MNYEGSFSRCAMKVEGCGVLDVRFEMWGVGVWVRWFVGRGFVGV